MTTFEFEYAFRPIDGDHQLLLMEAEDETIPVTVRFETDSYDEVEIVEVAYGNADVNLTALEEQALYSEIYTLLSFGEFAGD